MRRTGSRTANVGTPVVGSNLMGVWVCAPAAADRTKRSAAPLSVMVRSARTLLAAATGARRIIAGAAESAAATTAAGTAIEPATAAALPVAIAGGASAVAAEGTAAELAAAVGAHGEIRGLARFFDRPLGTRQRRANQPAVNRPFFHGRRRII